MAPRFRVERPGTSFVLPTPDAVLDAVEAGRLGADDVVFDAERHAFVRVRDHAELVAAWDARQRYRPAADRRPLAPDAALAFPALSAAGHTPAHGVTSDADLAQRRAAWRAIRDGTPPVAPRPESVLVSTGLVLAVLLLVLAGWSVLAFASGVRGVVDVGWFAR